MGFHHMFPQFSGTVSKTTVPHHSYQPQVTRISVGKQSGKHGQVSRIHLPENVITPRDELRSTACLLLFGALKVLGGKIIEEVKVDHPSNAFVNPTAG